MRSLRLFRFPNAFVLIIVLNLLIAAGALVMTGQPVVSADEPAPEPPLDLPIDGSAYNVSNTRDASHARDGETLVAPQWMDVSVFDPMSEPPLDPVVRDAMLEAASQEFGVPVDVLRAVGDLESGWMMRGGTPTTYFAYGVMGLRDNGVVNTLALAADLLGVKVSDLQHDAQTNIRGSAAVLRLFAGENAAIDDPAGWMDAIGAYSGLESPQLRLGYTQQIYQLMGELEIAANLQNSLRVTTTPRPDGCIGYSAVNDFAPASPYNFDEGERVPIDRVVIHIGQGTYWGGLGWFQNPAASVSAHYFVSLEGRVGQSVCEQDTAWHAGLWSMNQRSIGIEHEGWSGQTIFSNTVYQTTAAIVREVTARYRIPRDREHIIGHYQVNPPHRANCPGSTWNWDYFMSLVGPNDHLYTHKGELSLDETRTATMSIEDRWEVLHNGAGDLLFDVGRISGNLTFKLVLRDADYNLIAESTSSATGRALFRFTGVPAGRLFVHLGADDGHKGDYQVRVSANARPNLVMDGAWEDSYSNIDRWDANLGESPLNYYVEFERLTGAFEATIQLQNDANATLASVNSVNGRAIVAATSSGSLKVRLSGFAANAGSYRMRLRSGTPDFNTVQLLNNAGFEIADVGNIKIPHDWKPKNATNDNLKCNKFSRPNGKANKYVSYSDDCAFRFVGGAGEVSRIKQGVSGAGMSAGDTLTLNAFINAKNLLSGADFKLKVKYLDDLKEPIKQIIPISEGHYAYIPYGATVMLSGDVKKVVLQVRMAAPAGKFFIDDVTLTWTKDAPVLSAVNSAEIPPPEIDDFNRR